MSTIKHQVTAAIKKSVKKILRNKGYELYRKHYYDFNGDESLKKIVKAKLANKSKLTIFDVGANVGQSVDRFFKVFPQSQIYSFEPNPTAFDLLKKKEQQYPSLLTFNKGMADAVGTRTFFKQPDSGSSSFLRINKTGEEFGLSQTEAAKLNHNVTTVKESLNYNSEIRIETDTIDNFCRTNSIKHIDLLKIDTQGFEPEVLAGAKEMLSKISIIECEVILGMTYERSCSFFDIESKIREYGFFLWDIPYIGKFATDDVNRINFLDAIFVNRKRLGH